MAWLSRTLPVLLPAAIVALAACDPTAPIGTFTPALLEDAGPPDSGVVDPPPMPDAGPPRPPRDQPCDGLKKGQACDECQAHCDAANRPHDPRYVCDADSRCIPYDVFVMQNSNGSNSSSSSSSSP